VKVMNRPARVGVAGLLLVIGQILGGTAAAAPDPFESVVANDNTRRAGVESAGTLTLSLRAAKGTWRPEGPTGPSVDIEAFGETSSALMVPAPLIRVREDTAIAVSIRNDLASPLRVHGLCARDGTTCAPLDVPPAQTREARFTIARAGTYHYWATTMGAPVPFRELAGALVVDPAEDLPEADRVFVITEWTSLTVDQLLQIVRADDPGETFVAFRPRFVFTLNGLSWPATERLTYRAGDTVRWRVINLSSQAHPMHLHGFYFDVDRIGNGLVDRPVEGSRPRRVVTQLLPSGGTMAMRWTPEREGNWLFHCHVMHHVSPSRRFDDASDAHVDHTSHSGMAGMLMGVTVLGRNEKPAAEHDANDRLPRKLTLVMQDSGFVLGEGAMPPPSSPVNVPGPPIVLRRSEPVEITLVNRLSEATAIHWHGIELDSFYDGVHGWSGTHRRVTPMIDSGGTFVVRFTPPRAGTFIYHTHLHDLRQLSSGLYGPLIVTEPGETFDPATDHVLVLGRSGLTSEWDSIAGDSSSAVLNGERAPRFAWKSAAGHRLRLINITPDDILSVCLRSAEGPLEWRPLAKDGAPLDPAAATTAACQTIAVGETYDFEYRTPAGRRTLWLEARTTAGKWVVQGHVVVR
jgi:FtsP/CotA-like multicopper oxidase with cupredoxin domain